MEKVDFLTKKIECTTPIPFDQAWSRAYKKVGVVHSIDQGPEKSESEGAFYDTLCGRGRGRVGGSLRCGRQNVVAHGGVAVATDVRAVDGSEVVVRLGRREQAAGAAVPALGRERTEEGAGGGGGDGVDEEGAVLARGPGALGACVEAVALLVGLERIALVGDGAEDGLGGGGPAGELGEACGVEGVACGSGGEAVAG